MKDNNEEKNLYPDPDLPAPKEDFRESFQWKVFRIMAEFVDGYHFIAGLDKTITVFGSSSATSNNPYYKEAKKMGEILAENGYTVVTGGGPGIMKAANQGAYEKEGGSVGLNIKLPRGQRRNKYVKDGIAFNHFFVRKVMLSFSSQAYIFFPGGFGTLDEFFELVTLIQTKKIREPIPVIAVGKEYWKPLFKWIEETVYKKEGAIRKENLEILQLVDSAEEAYKIIEKSQK